jgi:seryl-tRNA synthetase
LETGKLKLQKSNEELLDEIKKLKDRESLETGKMELQKSNEELLAEIKKLKDTIQEVEMRAKVQHAESSSVHVGCGGSPSSSACSIS